MSLMRGKIRLEFDVKRSPVTSQRKKCSHTFFDFIKPAAETMTYCYASGILENRPNIRAMHLIDKFFMFLVRIKLGLFRQDLAHRFNLHISSVSRKITTWAN